MEINKRPSIYIETTIPSLYTSRPSPNIVELARQRLTAIWWEDFSQDFQLVTSQTVHDECSKGNLDLAAKRINFLRGISLLKLNESVGSIAKELLSQGIIPQKAADDAIHIAVASVHSIDYLLTWNCRHLANPMIWWRVSEIVTNFGYRPSIICTPEDLIGDEY